MATQSFGVLPFDIRKMIPQDFTYQEILNLCKTEKALAQVCRDDSFWALLLADRHPQYLPQAGLSAREMFRHAETMYIVYLYMNNNIIYTDESLDDDNLIAAVLAQEILSYVERMSHTRSKRNFVLDAYYPGGKKLAPHQIQAISKLHLVRTRGIALAVKLVEEGNDVYTISGVRPDGVSTLRRVMNVSMQTLQTLVSILSLVLSNVTVSKLELSVLEPYVDIPVVFN